jgi:hypothetical protein
LAHIQRSLALNNIGSLSEDSWIQIPDAFDIEDYKASVQTYFSQFQETVYSRKNFLKSVYDNDVKEFSENIFDQATGSLLLSKIFQLFHVNYSLERTKEELKKLIECCNEQIKAAAIKGAPITPSSVSSAQVLLNSNSASEKTPSTSSNVSGKDPSSAVTSVSRRNLSSEHPVAITPPKVSELLLLIVSYLLRRSLIPYA